MSVKRIYCCFTVLNFSSFSTELGSGVVSALIQCGINGSVSLLGLENPIVITLEHSDTIRVSSIMSSSK